MYCRLIRTWKLEAYSKNNASNKKYHGVLQPHGLGIRLVDLPVGDRSCWGSLGLLLSLAFVLAIS